MEKTAQQYRKKPVVIQAIQWDGNADTANKFIGESYGVDWDYINSDDRGILIPTLEGTMKCNLGDWIIKGVNGEFYPCKPDIFEKTYEPASLSSLPSDSEIEKAAEERKRFLDWLNNKMLICGTSELKTTTDILNLYNTLNTGK